VLIITRKRGERIMVGDDVVLQVIEVSGGSVRIGIDAPRSTAVHREEIWNAVRREHTVADADAKLPAPPAGYGPA
jgi:carbon storage regulator